MTPIPGLAPSIPESALQPVPCGLCGSSRSRLKFAEQPFSVVVCADCGLTYVTPRLRDADLLDKVYDEGYWASHAAKTRGYTDYRADAPLYLRTYRRRLALVRRHFDRPGRVLDVGCAAGYFLRVMQEAGWEVTGLEPSEPIRREAASWLGDGRVRGGTLTDSDLAPASFDLITFWDVIEHIPDPVAALRDAARLLKPQGKLLIETQNVASRAAALLGRRWQHYKHTEHIYHFAPDTLTELLRRGGFEVLARTARYGGKYVSLGFIAERAGKVHPLFSVLCAPLRLVPRAALYVNLYDEMIVVAAQRA